LALIAGLDRTELSALLATMLMTGKNKNEG
jgi:hypothetical protein